MWNDSSWLGIIWNWPKIWTRSNSWGVNSLRYFSLNHNRRFRCFSTPLLWVFLFLRIDSVILRISCFPNLSRPEPPPEQIEKVASRPTLVFFAEQGCHRRADYATRLKKQAAGPIIFRPNKRDFKVFVEAEQVDGREAWKGSRRHSSGSTEVLLRIKAMKLDSGKTVLTSFVWSTAAVSWHEDSVWTDVTLTPTGRQTSHSYRLKSRISPPVQGLGITRYQFQNIFLLILWKIYGWGECSWCSTSLRPSCEWVFHLYDRHRGADPWNSVLAFLLRT